MWFSFRKQQSFVPSLPTADQLWQLLLNIMGLWDLDGLSQQLLVICCRVGIRIGVQCNRRVGDWYLPAYGGQFGRREMQEFFKANTTHCRMF